MRSGRRPPPSTEPEKRAPGALAYWVFALSLVCGLVFGIVNTRIQGPRPQINAAPWQLRADDRYHYMMAIALEYSASGDSILALNKLIALRPAGDPLQELATAACALGSRGYLGSSSGITAIRSAVRLYTAFGREGCAESLLPAARADAEPPTVAQPAAALNRPTPLPTKAPLSANAVSPQTRRIIPTAAAQRTFAALSARSYCDSARPAIIEVLIVDYLGRGIPGQRIRVRWSDQEDIFVSGLKTDRGDAYADFQMEEGVNYALDMPAAADPLEASLSTGACFINNRRSLKSWRVTFVET